jgi:transcriptional regulator with XRE-family HTH domain
MKTQHEVLMESPEFRKLMAVESLVVEASETIARVMAEQKVNKAELARRLGKSRAWVTQLLSGTTNMTVRTLAEVSHELGFEIKLQAQPTGASASREKTEGGWKPVLYTLEGYRPGRGPEVFRLQSDRFELAEAASEPEADGEIPERPEYAA